jgi:lipopolysaccharide transport system ATP-binding protein
MTEVAVRVENLSKKYRIGGPQARYKTLRESLVDAAAAPVRRLHTLGQPSPENETIWALKDVSFEVSKGEVVGIIGRNGAGKTTLLKVLCRITEPTEGYAEIKGRVGSLLEVGTGFHPELTGRENIYLNGAILGMKRAEIDEKFDEIVAFSEIEKFLDTPVKRYSSGMYVRLAFSVAAHLEPEILLVDEVLAVGDAAFQKKCLGKMEGVAREGRTVLFVSHRMEAIEALCQSALLLEAGSLVFAGTAHSTVEHYLRTAAKDANTIEVGDRVDRTGSGEYRFARVWFTDDRERIVNAVRPGKLCRIHALVWAEDGAQPAQAFAAISVQDRRGGPLFTLSSTLIDRTVHLAGHTEIVWEVDRLQLYEGEYPCNLFLAQSSSGETAYGIIDLVRDAFVLSVGPGDYYGTGRTARSRNDKFFVDFRVNSLPHTQHEAR